MDSGAQVEETEKQYGDPGGEQVGWYWDEGLGCLGLRTSDDVAEVERRAR